MRSPNWRYTASGSNWTFCTTYWAQDSMSRAGTRVSNPAHRPTIASDRKSTRLNSSHSQISYAVFCLKKKKKKQSRARQPTVESRLLVQKTLAYRSWAQAASAYSEKHDDGTESIYGVDLSTTTAHTNS